MTLLLHPTGVLANTSLGGGNNATSLSIINLPIQVLLMICSIDFIFSPS